MNMDSLMTDHGTWLIRYVGMPYAEDGDDADSGLSCYNFVRLLYREQFSIFLPEHPWAEDWREIEDDERPEEGDVVLVRMPGNRTHVGVYLSHDYMLHASPGGVVVGSIRDHRVSKRLMGIHRHRHREAAVR